MELATAYSLIAHAVFNSLVLVIISSTLYGRSCLLFLVRRFMERRGRVKGKIFGFKSQFATQ
ncbi:uncharacterized protein ASPGLDRAFT_1506613 [Aspergillus glaucus CBS 516.65]|uniref:Uncharacterized protein n=1 Tax=Aspergillus glaucus CBS 516.65 TaxID=1160497 RepID=A0A1L9V6F2_ASPGL|nr:hypothetical protein ASPGLDRAFT_1506613 [Aspergillus glaucus CBS 516.65]OJJ79507.1 hypothetical protein ASPGLDRAFT_1506613 [Aspergillus glaucus CBS 516.65]